MDYKGKKALVVGMARSGIAAASLLLELGASVTIYDAKPEDSFAEGTFQALLDGGAQSFLGKDPEGLVEEVDLLVLSPGVPLDLPFIRKAYKQKKIVMSEIELGFDVAGADFIAITGTNGKTTTTALTGELFKNAGINTYVLGNIGVPITQEALNIKKGDVVVAETAALQLDTIIGYQPKGSAILNITEDHMDRYGSMENYIAAKARIFKNQTKEDYCVLNQDNEIVRSLAPLISAKVLWFSTEGPVLDGAYVEDGNIVYVEDGKKQVVVPTGELQIPGRHNLENALAATVLAMKYGISKEKAAHTLRTFTGVEHRLEMVRSLNGVTFINDSKGTNPDATINAIRAMDRPTILILGGFDKHGEFGPLFDAFTDNIKAVIILGETTHKIVSAAKEAGFVKYIVANGFEDAVLKAYSLALDGDAVLLSPACASWDMFRDFEERGDVFKKIVRGLT
ncbi:MAG: UDP-N-acetylmuramoyl-L-alanine--D-glutamate ligase [Christensenellaceae bacterium]|jgi:UDP-N-acetylmuramoylalanine--D-glutamate ligase